MPGTLLELVGYLAILGLALGFGLAAGFAAGLGLAVWAANKVVIWLERKGLLP